jgi:MIP family channel proteins
MDIKPTLAELVGTFTLVFIGAAAGAQAESTSAGLVAVALAHGLALMVIVYAWGSISGAHVNPAVTFGVLASGKISLPKAIAYWIAQFAGAVAAAYVLRWFLGAGSNLGATIGSLTPHGAVAGDAAKVVVLEAILTFFLVIAVMASGVYGVNGNLAGVAIGLVLAMDILAGGPLTGASMNPARTFGPALATGDMNYFWMYLVGPLAGGAVAGLLFSQYFMAAGVTSKAK